MPDIIHIYVYFIVLIYTIMPDIIHIYVYFIVLIYTILPDIIHIYVYLTSMTFEFNTAVSRDSGLEEGCVNSAILDASTSWDWAIKSTEQSWKIINSIASRADESYSFEAGTLVCPYKNPSKAEQEKKWKHEIFRLFELDSNFRDGLISHTMAYKSDLCEKAKAIAGTGDHEAQLLFSNAGAKKRRVAGAISGSRTK